MIKVYLMKGVELIGHVLSSRVLTTKEMCVYMGVKYDSDYFLINITNDKIEEAKLLKNLILQYEAFIPDLTNVYMEIAGVKYLYDKITNPIDKIRFINSIFKVLEL